MSEAKVLRGRTALIALLGLALAGVLAAAAPGEEMVAAKWHSCRDVVVQFQPEGSGGGTKVRAKKISCRGARKTIRRCINGELRPGWSGSYKPPKFVLRKGKRRIRYLPVGGGGCVPVSGNQARAR